MAMPLSLDAPTLVIANVVISFATLVLLLITRFGTGPSGRRTDGWIAGDLVLLCARLGVPLAWLLGRIRHRAPYDGNGASADRDGLHRVCCCMRSAC